MLIRAKKDGAIHGAIIVTKGLSIFHLFFANNSFVFCKFYIDEIRKVKDIIKDCYYVSRQMINYKKSDLCIIEGASRKFYNFFIAILGVKEDRRE